MSIEIKFRYVLQHGETGRIMTNVCSLEDLENGTVCYWLETLVKIGWAVIARNQCSGLKDKNGKEIYKDDICKGGMLLCTGGYSIKNDTATTVKFEDGMFKLGSVSLISYARRTEVIGNIYQHPELLKEA